MDQDPLQALSTQIRNVGEDEISDLGKGKTQNKKLRFPAMLLDNNAVICWLRYSILKDCERMADFMLYFYEMQSQKKTLFMLKFVTNSCSPINSISSHWQKFSILTL